MNRTGSPILGGQIIEVKRTKSSKSSPEYCLQEEWQPVKGCDCKGQPKEHAMITTKFSLTCLQTTWNYDASPCVVWIHRNLPIGLWQVFTWAAHCVWPITRGTTNVLVESLDAQTRVNCTAKSETITILREAALASCTSIIDNTLLTRGLSDDKTTNQSERPLVSSQLVNAHWGCTETCKFVCLSWFSGNLVICWWTEARKKFLSFMIATMEHFTEVHERRRPRIPKAARRNPTNSWETNTQQVRKRSIRPSKQDNKDSNQAKVNFGIDSKNFWKLGTVQELGNRPQPSTQFLEGTKILMPEIRDSIWSLRHTMSCEMQVTIQRCRPCQRRPWDLAKRRSCEVFIWGQPEGYKWCNGRLPSCCTRLCLRRGTLQHDTWTVKDLRSTLTIHWVLLLVHPLRECLKSIMIDQVLNKRPSHTVPTNMGEQVLDTGYKTSLCNMNSNRSWDFQPGHDTKQQLTMCSASLGEVNGWSTLLRKRPGQNITVAELVRLTVTNQHLIGKLWNLGSKWARWQPSNVLEQHFMSRTITSFDKGTFPLGACKPVSKMTMTNVDVVWWEAEVNVHNIICCHPPGGMFKHSKAQKWCHGWHGISSKRAGIEVKEGSPVTWCLHWRESLDLQCSKATGSCPKGTTDYQSETQVCCVLCFLLTWEIGRLAWCLHWFPLMLLMDMTTGQIGKTFHVGDVVNDTLFLAAAGKQTASIVIPSCPIITLTQKHFNWVNPMVAVTGIFTECTLVFEIHDILHS